MHRHPAPLTMRPTGNKFIICGASRSGKSILAKRLQRRFQISWIVGDAIVSSMEDAFPELGVSHHGDLRGIGDRLEDYVKYLLWNYDYEGCGYVFDATHLFPRNIAGIRNKIGDVPAVFLGYAEADKERKLREIRSFDPDSNWWTAERSDSDLMRHIEDHIGKSAEIKKECAELGIPYIETSHDFEKSVLEAERILTSDFSV